MVATTKVYLFVCFLVLVIGFYFQREDYDYFQGVSCEDYDYFLLVLQWPPSFCNTGKKKCREDVKNFSNFTIHGLWPKKQTQNGGDIDCKNKTGHPFNITELKEDNPLIERMNKYWPNLEAKENDVFWDKQWNKHGKCIGWEQNPYFNKACSMKEIASLDETFATNGILKGNSYPIENYMEAIRKTLGVKPKLRCNNRPSTKDTQVLVEVCLCVDKTGTKFQKCGTLDFGDVTLTSCTDDSLIEFPTWP